MLTRGHFIGEIVDALSDVAGQVSTRGRLGLTDLNKHLEDFFMLILNELLPINLKNLNEERSNEPGLDLGDKANKVAFQITATRTSAKVNDTLKALTSDQINTYSKIRVLMIAGKQGTYSLDAANCTRASFSVDDIWDIDDLGKLCMDAPLDCLQRIYNHVRSELARVKIELEIPDSEGNYPTNLKDYIEAVPTPTMSDLTKFNKYIEDSGWGEDLSETEAAFKALSVGLAKLPRITREFLAMLMERRETEARRGLGSLDRIEINADKLERISRYSDNEGELRVLASYDFIRFDEPDEYGQSAYWVISFPDFKNERIFDFLTFSEANNIALQRALITLDFSGF